MYNILGELKSKEKSLRSFTKKELNLVVDTLMLEFIPKKIVPVEIISRDKSKINDNWNRSNSWKNVYRFTKRKDIKSKEIAKNIEYYSSIIYEEVKKYDSTINFIDILNAINRKKSKLYFYSKYNILKTQ